MNKVNRVKRHLKIRKGIVGTRDRPRVAVFRSNKHIFAQAIDDAIGKTVVACSDMKIDKKMTKKEKAYQIGVMLAEKIKKMKVSEVIFDRGGFLYHGRIAEIARGLREGGLKF